MVRIENLTKEYRKLRAVDNLSLTIEEGDAFGFIGPNGAGKTTTIRVLATLLAPTSGDAYIDGVSVTKEPEKIRNLVGYMPDFFGVYDDVKAWEYLDFFASAHRVPAARRKRVIEDVLELTDLTGKRDAFVDELSRGMKQRLCLAKTLVHDPKVLLLDEPASGLDPRARIELRELLKELRKMGKTIFISSHILPELADFCNRIGILEQGKLVVSGPVHEIAAQVRTRNALEIGVCSDAQQAVEVCLKHPSVRTAEVTDGRIVVEFIGEKEQLPDFLLAILQQGVKVTSLVESEMDLEDVFLKVTKGVVS
jgi:ABC-2 type transport system ATP-binding protein